MARGPVKRAYWQQVAADGQHQRRRRPHLAQRSRAGSPARFFSRRWSLSLVLAGSSSSIRRWHFFFVR